MGIYNFESLLRESFKKIKMKKLSLHPLLVVVGLMISYSSAIYGEEPSPLGGSDRIIQASELPTDSIVPESKIQEIKKKIQDGEIKMEPGAVGKFLDTLRKKRSDDHVSKAWCCKLPRTNSTIREPYAASRVVEKMIPAGGTEKCGFAGWNRCTSDKQTKITILEYYTVYKYISVPSAEWNNGCPEKQIVCCAGYIYRKNSTNCLTWDEYAQMIVTQMRYCHINLGILDTFAALPTSMPCPKVDGI